MRITGTFLDEISVDIPHQNWGYAEWDLDFAAMKAVGIKTVILIRCGYMQWMTFPSKVLGQMRGGYNPPVDLVRMFLELAAKHDMAFYFGLYDSYEYVQNNQLDKELDINLKLIDEVWAMYGGYPAFKGWYLTHEFSRFKSDVMDVYASIGRHAKEVSGGLPILISPYIEGKKILSEGMTAITPERHEAEWDQIMSTLNGAVDIVAFQDGHVDFNELEEFLVINKALADKHGMQCWTNSETFDRDMPIKFPPIKWEKLLLKLNAAERAGYENAITFEFSHFMSPNSCYPQAHHLYKRYCEHFGISI
ncbi:DUF4434 domain-containing protein [bacterium]|nr:DUF4434 domain-containing protein [bacterium]